ncbi:MAG: hypothetical protein IT495_16555 [Gammaproteobacteria bacterium]|nr:hypothetical protein [Gammaproteobacteria bacterium]
MGLLDELKREADAKREREMTDVERRELYAERLRRDIDPRMTALRRYLVDLTKELNYLEPDVAVDYDIPGACRLERLHQQDYIVSAYHDGEFVLRFRCVGPTHHRVRIEEPAAVRKLQGFLREHGLEFQLKEVTDERWELKSGVFTIGDEVEVRFTFRANPEHDGVLMSQRHFTGITEQQFLFPAVVVDRAFHDQLGEYVLRRSDALLDHQVQLISDAEREALKKRLDERLQKK